jgi:hypothetical protein
MNPRIQFKNKTALFFLAFALGCFVLGPLAQAQLSPPPDGGYPNQNTAEGDFALRAGTAGINNSAFGFAALANNTGSYNTGIGAAALYVSDGGNFNTATGYSALYFNSGSENTATGFDALNSNAGGSDNTADGFMALFLNTQGAGNTGIGSAALFSNASDDNTAVGSLALSSNVFGSRNIALGAGAGSNVGTGAPGDDNIEIGNIGGGFDTGTIRIGTVGTQGAAFIAGVFGVNTGMGSQMVTINADGQLGSAPIVSPVSLPRFKVQGKSMTLVNEFLKERKAFLAERRKVQKQEAAIAELKSEMKALIATVKEQSSQIQKVSAQLELRKPSPQTVLNNQ